MENTQRKSYDEAFHMMKAINLAVQEGHNLGINELMVRRWRCQREELSQSKRTTKAFRGNHNRWLELENFFEDWLNTQTESGCSVSMVQIRLKAEAIATEMRIKDFRGG